MVTPTLNQQVTTAVLEHSAAVTAQSSHGCSFKGQSNEEALYQTQLREDYVKEKPTQKTTDNIEGNVLCTPCIYCMSSRVQSL